jgi:hypothetical protein
MLHVTPQSAQQSSAMSKLDQFDAFIASIRERREAIIRQIAELKAANERAQKEVETIDESLKTLTDAREKLSSDFIAMLEKTNFETLDLQKPQSQVELSPAVVADQARAVLIEEGRPMKRGQLVKALLRRGIPLAGTDKNKNLGTILWRHKNQFVSLNKLGYWVKDVPLEGIYTPEE